MPRGGFRPNAGRKRKNIKDALLDGTRKSRTKIVAPPKSADRTQIDKKAAAKTEKARADISKEAAAKTKKALKNSFDAVKIARPDEWADKIPDYEMLRTTGQLAFMAPATPEEVELQILAEAHYGNILSWVKERNCLHLFNLEFLERYAILQTRFEQVEQRITNMGFLTLGAHEENMLNPLFTASNNIVKQLNAMNLYIINEVNRNCTETLNRDALDPMESLLTL